MKYLQERQISPLNIHFTAKKRQRQAKTRSGSAHKLPTEDSGKNASQANSISLSAGSSTSYVSKSCIGDRFSVPGNANCFLPGVDEFVLDESVCGVAFRLPVQISWL